MIQKQIRNIADKTKIHREIIQRLSFYYGISRTKEIITALKQHSLYYPIRVNTLQTSREKLLKSFESKDILVEKHPILDECLLIKAAGPFTLTENEKTITINEKAARDVMCGANLGVPGILEHEDINIGEEVSLVDRFETIVANGVAMMNSREIKQKKKGIAVKTTKSRYFIPNLHHLKEYLRGQFIHQSLTSMIVGVQVKLQKKDRLLEMTMGEGELLTHIWQRNAKNQFSGRILANARFKSHLQASQENIKRLRMHNAPFETHLLKIDQIQTKFSRNETFDKIILNAPCSELGVRPKIHDTTTEKRILKFANKQKQMIEQAARLLKPGGILFYHTLSIDPAENEEIITYATEEYNLQLQEQSLKLGESGISSYNNADLMQRFYPDKHPTNGAFIAKLIK